jgi:acyl-CoA hydrolase
MDFRHSIAGGETVVLKGRAAHVGRSSITIHITAHALRVGQEITIDTEGFATFVHIVEGRAEPHGLEVEPPTDPKSWTLWERVVRAREQQRKEGG